MSRLEMVTWPAALLPALMGLAVAAIAVEPESTHFVQTSHTERIQAKGFLDLRCYPQIDSPFLWYRLESGPMKDIGTEEQYSGIDIEIAKTVAQRLGVELRIRPIREPKLSHLFDSLLEGDGDIVGGGITITPNRRERFAFSDPYLDFSPVLVGLKDRELRVEDLPKMKLAVLSSSAFDEMVTAEGVPEDRISREEFNTGSIEKLTDGQADLTIYDSCALPEEIEHSLEVYFKFNLSQSLGIMLPLDSDLKPVVDEALAEMQASGELQELFNRLLRSVDLATLPEISPHDLCGDRCN